MISVMVWFEAKSKLLFGKVRVVFSFWNIPAWTGKMSTLLLMPENNVLSLGKEKYFPPTKGYYYQKFSKWSFFKIFLKDNLVKTILSVKHISHYKDIKQNSIFSKKRVNYI